MAKPVNSAKDSFKRLFSKLRSDRKTLASMAKEDGRSSYRSHQRNLDLLHRDIAAAEQNLGMDRTSSAKSPLPGTKTAEQKEFERTRPHPFGNTAHWKTAVMSHPIASKIFGGVEPRVHDGEMTFSKMDDNGFSHHLGIKPSDSGKFRVDVRAGDTRHKFLPFEYGSLPVSGEDSDLNKAMDSAFSSHDLRNEQMKQYHTKARTFDYNKK